MIGVSRDDSATVDEASHLGVGYIYWKGAHTRLGAEEHPPLASLVETFPLLFMDVKLSDIDQAMVRGELGYPWTVSWNGTIRPVTDLVSPACQRHDVRILPFGDLLVQWSCPSNYPVNNWYYQAVPEAQMFGKFFVYGGDNDGDAMLFAGRMAQTVLTLLTGLVIFFWVRRATGRDDAAVVALALWTFNPVVLAYGHVANTDMGAAFGITLSAYLFARLVEQPTLKNAALAGAATGMALCMKFTTLILGPVFLVMLVLAWGRLKLRVWDVGKLGGVYLLVGWCVTLLVFLPFAAPAPPPTETDLATFNLPFWFRALRPVLVPSGLFKGIAIALGHSKGGTESYLMGHWSKSGWWYYFPVAFLLKMPVAYVLMVGGGLLLFIRQAKSARVLEQICWLGACLYLFCTMTSGINIGVRHLLPMLALLAVGTGCAFSRLANRWLRLTAMAFLGWLAATVLLAYPLYIQFFSEAVGGARNGYQYLIDSNYDWGQDAKRLKRFLDERQIDHIYLDYFGNQFSVEYLKIPNTRVSPEQAKHIPQGTLVVSASLLMRPEWKWLRDSHQPMARVAHTLFVYQLP